MNNKDVAEIYNRYTNSKLLKENHFDDLFDDESWQSPDTDSCCMDSEPGWGPESFSDSVRTMPVSELLNQIKGHDEGLYRKLIYYIRDTYHEDNKPTSEPSFDSPISIEDIDDNISSCGMSPIKRISIIRKESVEPKQKDLDLLISIHKAKK